MPALLKLLDRYYAVPYEDWVDKATWMGRKLGDCPDSECGVDDDLSAYGFHGP